ncbi:C-C motif chemokine 20b [Sphaeramia orbicularis]|uniref:C-C motif chemokine 20-like n=1 Tax=Sphaeramia orbicularis TaxID=375764 RepID=A0A672YSK2_9TELE|nr:C-C motif chemokine 20-like [Sphaeramia orbicularis]
MTGSKSCLLAVVCSLVIITNLIGSAQSWSCCLTYAKRPYSCKRLLAYSIQTINTACDINAIIFHLPNGRFVCADPLANWTQRGMKCVDTRRKKEMKVLQMATSGNSTTASS